MSRHPIDVLKAALQEAKTEAATLRIKTATLAKERNVAIEECNEARARVKELEQQNAVQRENVDEAMRETARLTEKCGAFKSQLQFLARRLENESQKVRDQDRNLPKRAHEHIILIAEWELLNRLRCPVNALAAENTRLGGEVERMARALEKSSRAHYATAAALLAANGGIQRGPWSAASRAAKAAGDAAVTAAASDNAPFRQPEPDTLSRIRELEAEVQRLQQDRAQVGAFGFKPLGIR